MHRIRFACLALLFLVGCSSFRPSPPEAATPGEKRKEPIVTHARRAIARYANDPLAVRSLNPAFDTFPDASLVDFSFLLDPPAGKHGFVEARPDGHFYLPDSDKPVKFWGVTVAASHIDIPKDRIRETVDVIARSGCNLIRLHELDNRGGEKYKLIRRNIIDEAFPNNDVSTHFDAEYRDRVDYWIACAQERGIYVYLVVLGYRTFRTFDEVQNATPSTAPPNPTPCSTPASSNSNRTTPTSGSSSTSTPIPENPTA